MWTVAEGRSVYVVEYAEGAGTSVVTIFLDDLDAQVAAIAARGLEPDERLSAIEASETPIASRE
ncbi:MAG: hypothetical protein ACR2JH_06245 [Solirubrobacteraceae bacterium]